MATTKLLITCVFCCAVYSCTSAKGDIRQNTPEWLPLSAEAQERIISDYATALDEFAQVMPKFGSDTESLWAADTVHTMATSLKQNHYPFLQSYATICQMQNYTSYGMAYVNAIIGTYKSPDLADYALRFISLCDTAYCKLKETEFDDVKLLSMFKILSIQNMQLFNTLNRVNNDQPADEQLSFAMYSLQVIDSLASLQDYSDKDIYKIATIYESYSSFQMVCPLLMLFSGTKEKYDLHVDVIYEAAKHFDSQSTPVFKSISDGRKVDVMNDSEFEEWMLADTKYKVKLLELLTKFVKEWNQ